MSGRQPASDACAERASHLATVDIMTWSQMTNDVPMNLAKSLAILEYGLSSTFPRKVPISRRTPLLVPSPIFTASNDETLLWSGETDSVYSENFGNLPKSTPTRLSNSNKKTRSSREVGGVSRGSGLIWFGERSPPLPQTVDFSTI